MTNKYYGKVLIIDDEEMFREDLSQLLQDEGHECRTAANGDLGISIAQDFRPQIILCDITMPGKNGLEVLDEIKTLVAEVSIMMITAYGTLKTSVEAFRMGASDYILKPFVLEDVLQKIQRLLENQEMNREIEYLRRKIQVYQDNKRLVGKSKSIKNIQALIKKTAPTDTTVLISGESGTGKEIAALSIHEASNRNQERFIAVNCAAIPDSLIESELFGHKKGSFTGAIQDKHGLFELAHKGTLFLDEISEMPLDQQAKLLRALEEKVIQPVGGTEQIEVDTRIIAASNRNLAEWVQEGKFREDLFYRLNVLEIEMMPLKERREDIPELTKHFIQILNSKLKKNFKGIDSKATKLLMSYPWPGNVRELLNTIERAMILSEGDLITLENLPNDIVKSMGDAKNTQNLKDAVRAYEQEHIQQVLNETEGNREEAAKLLGINVATLYRKMSEQKSKLNEVEK